MILLAPSTSPSGEPEGLEARQVRFGEVLQESCRLGPLQREQRPVVGFVSDFYVEVFGVLAEVFEILLAVGGVDDDEEVILAPVDDHIVHRPPVLVADRRVTGLPDVQAGYVAGDEALDGAFGVGTAEDRLAHVRDVEEPGVVANRPVLGLDARVLHGHLVAGEVHEPGSEVLVLLVERGVPEIFFRHPYHLALSCLAARVSSRRRVGACVGASSRSS